MTLSWSKEPCGRQKGCFWAYLAEIVVVEQSAVAVGGDLEARQTWTDSQLCHSLAEWPWVAHLFSLRLSFPGCKPGILHGIYLLNL